MRPPLAAPAWSWTDAAFFVSDSTNSVNADIHVRAAGSWLNGNSNQTVTFGGDLTSDAGANLGTTAAGNPTLTTIFTGNLTGFVGTMHSGQGNVVLAFGNGGAAATLGTGEFIKAVSMGGAGTYRVNYTGTGSDLLYTGNVIDTAALDVQGGGQTGSYRGEHVHRGIEDCPELLRPAGRRDRG